MSLGKIVLHRFNGDEEFEIQEATIFSGHDYDGVGYLLYFEAKSNGVRIKSLPDTAEFHGWPSAQVEVALQAVEPDRLVGCRFSVPHGYDEEVEDDVASFYYFEHEDLDNNELEVLSQEGDVFQIRWTGTTCDVNFRDGSKPLTNLEIDGRFTFKDMAKSARPPKK